MKKAVLVLMSMALAVSSMFTPAMAAERVSVDNIPAEGYEFVDIAYNGEGTFVAMAKRSPSYDYTSMYYSNDYGETWSKNPNNQPEQYVNAISANMLSQQQLLWWDAQNVFIAHNTKGTYTSEDGKNWTSSDVSWTSASMLSVSGDYLLHGANQKARATKNLNEMTATDNPIYTITSNANYYVKAIAAKPEEDGNIEVLIAAMNCLNSYNLDTETLKWTENATGLNNTSLPSEVYDMIYAQGADQFLFVDGSAVLWTASPANETINLHSFTVKDGVNVTGVNANDKYIVVGMSDGTMYYTANAPITAQTQWTQVPDMDSDEPIKNIEFIDSNNFVALGTTKIYKGSLVPEQEAQDAAVTQPVFKADATTAGDGYLAKTATFTLTPNGNTDIDVLVKVGEQTQSRTIDASVDAEIKLGIIVVSDSAEKLDNITAEASVAE